MSFHGVLERGLIDQVVLPKRKVHQSTREKMFTFTGHLEQAYSNDYEISFHTY